MINFFLKNSFSFFQILVEKGQGFLAQPLVTRPQYYNLWVTLHTSAAFLEASSFFFWDLDFLVGTGSEEFLSESLALKWKAI